MKVTIEVEIVGVGAALRAARSAARISQAVASPNNVSDDEAIADILAGIEEEIEQVSGDGASDKRKCYDEIAARGATPTIPPRKDAARWQDDPKTGEVHPRNRVLERIEAVGRQHWKQESGYHRRSLAETTIVLALVSSR